MKMAGCQEELPCSRTHLAENTSAGLHLLGIKPGLLRSRPEALTPLARLTREAAFLAPGYSHREALRTHAFGLECSTCTAPLPRILLLADALSSFRM